MFVPIIMGSGSDLEHGQTIAKALASHGIESVIRVASAHKATRYCLELLEQYEADPRKKVYITVAGRSNALSGVVDANVTSPVIACPPYSSKFGGADIYSSLRMPSGIGVGIALEPKSAALLAAKILAVGNPELQAGIAQKQKAALDLITSDDIRIREL